MSDLFFFCMKILFSNLKKNYLFIAHLQTIQIIKKKLKKNQRERLNLKIKFKIKNYPILYFHHHDLSNIEKNEIFFLFFLL